MATPASSLVSVEGYLPLAGAPKGTVALAWDVVVPFAVFAAFWHTGMPRGWLHWFVAIVLALVALTALINLFTVQI